VTVVTDTTAYLPRELIDKHGVELISLYYSFDGIEWIRESDVDDGDWGPFYERLATSKKLPTTQPPHVEDFRAIYEPILAEGGSVVSIHLSSGLSETCDNARKAVDELIEAGRGGERVHVVDSASACMQEALLALAAARAAADGGDPDSVFEHVRKARQEARNWFALDTLEFLKRGGRVGGAAAWLGGTLKIKPILTVESEIKAVERVRTTERAFERLVEYGRQLHAAGADGYAIQHARAEKEALALSDRLTEVFGRPPVYTSEIGPVIGTHTGPGLLGVGGLPSRFLE
jgi:fatty acid kinase fatty acid binding subunit